MTEHPVRVELPLALFRARTWVIFVVTVGLTLFATKIWERSITMKGSPAWEVFVSGVQGRAVNISFLLFVTSALFMVFVHRAAFILVEITEPNAVVFKLVRAVWLWLALTFLGWVLYIVSIAAQPDPGTFLKMGDDLRVRVLQTIEGISNLVVFAATYWSFVLAWLTTTALKAHKTLPGTDEEDMKCSALNSLRMAASAPLAVQGGLFFLYLFVGITDPMSGIAKGNDLRVVGVITAILLLMYAVLWAHIWLTFRQVRRGRRAMSPPSPPPRLLTPIPSPPAPASGGATTGDT